MVVIFFTFLIPLKSDYLNAEYLFEELEIDTSTKTEDDSSALPTNPFELVEMIRRQNSMNDATDPSDACLLYTSPSPRDSCASRMPSSA